MYSEQCKVYSVQWTVYSEQCKLNSVKYTVFLETEYQEAYTNLLINWAAIAKLHWLIQIAILSSNTNSKVVLVWIVHNITLFFITWDKPCYRSIKWLSLKILSKRPKIYHDRVIL